MKTVIFVFAVLLLTTLTMRADDDYIAFAKSLTAKQYDNNLPAIPIQQWLTSNLPGDVEIVWGENITDCGEQTGNPEIDRVRDMPLCAEVELKKKGELIGYFLLFVGTEKKGKMKEAGLYYGYFKEGNKTINLKQLGDIKKMKNARQINQGDGE